MSVPEAEVPEERVSADLPGVFVGHLLAYADLITALLQSWQASVQRKILGSALAAAGFSVCTLLLTIGAVAAAWATPYRWAVLLGIAGAYLLLGLLGIWLLLRRPAVPAPMSILADELRKDATLVSTILRERSK